METPINLWYPSLLVPVLLLDVEWDMQVRRRNGKEDRNRGRKGKGGRMRGKVRDGERKGEEGKEWKRRCEGKRRGEGVKTG